ncbi:Alpha/Beta hydrolase protein, partial [Melanogaster broomeanus]
SLSDTIVLGQAVFATEERIFTTGYEKTLDGRFLGIKWCSNRPASIWELMLPAVDPTTESSLGTSSVCTAVKIEVPGRSSRSPPRALWHGRESQAVVLALAPSRRAAYGMLFFTCPRLGWRTEDRVLVHGIFWLRRRPVPGFIHWTFNLLANPFIYNDDTIRRPADVLEVETGDISHERMWFGGSPSEGWTVLVTDGVSRMWKKLSGDLAMSVIPIPDRHPTETIVLKPKKAAAAAGPRPYLRYHSHGGPHSAVSLRVCRPFCDEVLSSRVETLYLCPTSPESVGFGDKYVHKLLGHIGTLDIGDCIAAVEELIKLGISESGRQLVQGVSHGGFITGHLIGQCPDVFKAAVMQNPVTSLGEFASSSDIPDFPLVEMGIPYAPGTCVPVTPDVYKTLYEASPIAHRR